MSVLLRTPWRAGPAPPFPGPLLVSLTAFTARQMAELPGVYRAALRLRRSWPQIEGAVGLWLWSEPAARRAGSVSVWHSEEDLRRFVSWAPHVEIMRRYRERGALVSSSWFCEGLELAELWRQAKERLAPGSA